MKAGYSRIIMGGEGKRKCGFYCSVRSIGYIWSTTVGAHPFKEGYSRFFVGEK